MSTLKKFKVLSKGIFWILTDNYNLIDYKFLIFSIPCDRYGNPVNTHFVNLNAKSNTTFNHKKTWESEVKNNNKYRPHNKKEYDYYPRGRVEISNGKATIFLNPSINTPEFISLIIQEFGIITCDIKTINVISDGSKHYQCFVDKSYDPSLPQ